MHVDAARGQRQRRVRQIEGDARRVVDGEATAAAAPGPTGAGSAAAAGPARGCTSMDCSAGCVGGAAPALPGACRVPLRARARRAQRSGCGSSGDGRCILENSLLRSGYSFRRERGGAFDVAAEAVRNDFNQTDLDGADVGDLAVGLAEVVARPVPDARGRPWSAPGRRSGRRGCSVPTIFKVSSENCSRNSRLRLDSGRRPGRPRPHRAARQERRAHVGVGVHEGLVRLDLGQRLDAAARLLLGLLDEALQVVVGARAAARAT